MCNYPATCLPAPLPTAWAAPLAPSKRNREEKRKEETRKKQKGNVPLFSGCCNKSPQIGWLRNLFSDGSRSMKAEIEMSARLVPSGASEGDSVPYFPASSGCRHASVFLGLWLRHSSLGFLVTWPSLCLRVQISFFLYGHQSLDQGLVYDANFLLYFSGQHNHRQVN